MGFFKRLLGGSAPSASQPASSGNWSAQLTAAYFTKTPDDAVLEVVGEHFRQANVLGARPPRAGELPPGLPPPPDGLFKAMLVQEPTNQYDANAVQVLLWAGGSWAQVGYLARDAAPWYGHLFRYLSRDGRRAAIACDANVIRERGEAGVVLHLGTPGECIAELVTDGLERADHDLAGKWVVLSGQGTTLVGGVPLDRPGQLALAAWAGCEVMPRVTKKTAALIVADPSDRGTAYQKAAEYGIRMVSGEDLLRQAGLPAELLGGQRHAWARG